MTSNEGQTHVEFVDRKGQHQEGKLEEILRNKGKGIETIQDAIALAWHALLKDKQTQKDKSC